MQINIIPLETLPLQMSNITTVHSPPPALPPKKPSRRLHVLPQPHKYSQVPSSCVVTVSDAVLRDVHRVTDGTHGLESAIKALRVNTVGHVSHCIRGQSQQLRLRLGFEDDVPQRNIVVASRYEAIKYDAEDYYYDLYSLVCTGGGINLVGGDETQNPLLCMRYYYIDMGTGGGINLVVGYETQYPRRLFHRFGKRMVRDGGM